MFTWALCEEQAIRGARQKNQEIQYTRQSVNVWKINTINKKISLIEKSVILLISSVQSLSRIRLFATPWTAVRRPPCPSPTPRVHPNPCPSSQWCHPAISSSVIPFSSCPHSFPASGSFQMSQLSAWGGQSIGVSASTSVPPMNTQDWSISFRMDLLDLLAVQGTLKSLLQHHSSKASILRHSAFFTVQLSQPYMTTGKTIALTRRTFVDKVMSLLLNMLSRLVITFLPRSKRLLISWLQSPSAVLLKPPKIQSATVSPSISHEVMELDAMILVFWMLSFKPTFSLSTFTFIKRLLSSSSLSAIRVVSSAYLRWLIFLPAAILFDIYKKWILHNRKSPQKHNCSLYPM